MIRCLDGEIILHSVSEFSRILLRGLLSALRPFYRSGIDIGEVPNGAKIFLSSTTDNPKDLPVMKRRYMRGSAGRSKEAHTNSNIFRNRLPADETTLMLGVVSSYYIMSSRVRAESGGTDSRGQGSTLALLED